MAGGWAKDSAVQEQIDASVADAVNQVRLQLPKGKSLTHCWECEIEIPEPRRQAIQGIQFCISCQSELEKQQIDIKYVQSACK